MSTYAPFAKPLYVMLKPVGAVCNLACDYCYYLEKSKLWLSLQNPAMKAFRRGVWGQCPQGSAIPVPAAR